MEALTVIFLGLIILMIIIALMAIVIVPQKSAYIVAACEYC